MKKVMIIGGGPAGMMAAIACKQRNQMNDVFLLERNERLGEKLRLTGGGRCNLTADVSHEDVIKHIPRNGRFLFSSLNLFDAQSIQDFFTSRGCKLKVEDHHRVFPMSNSAKEVVDVLDKEMKRLGVQVLLQHEITSVDVEQRVLSSQYGKHRFDFLIIATGGITYPQTGSDQLGFDLLASFGHTVTPLLPAEVPLVSNDAFIQSKVLQGLSFQDVQLSGYVQGKRKVSLIHDLLFTHFGLSGPGPLQVSSYLVHDIGVGKEVEVIIDFLPSVSFEQLQSEINLGEIDIVLRHHGLPKRFIQFLLEQSDSQDVVSLCKKFKVKISDRRGVMNAFVTSGGVSIKEVDPRTMKSKLYPYVSICGEALDLNGSTGGYNMTIAFSSGYSAGWHVCDSSSMD